MGVESTGWDALDKTFSQLGSIPEPIQDEMLQAEERIITPKQKAKGQAYGVHRTGVTLESIRAGRIGNNKNGKHLDIYPQGTNRQGRPNAEVAFVNEYGVRGTPPRPFIRDANEEAADAAFEAAVRVYDDWLENLD